MRGGRGPEDNLKRNSWRSRQVPVREEKRLRKERLAENASSGRSPPTEPFETVVTTGSPDPAKTAWEVPRAMGTAPSGPVQPVVGRPATYAGN